MRVPLLLLSLIIQFYQIVEISEFDTEHSSFEPARTSPLQSGHTLLNTARKGNKLMNKK